MDRLDELEVLLAILDSGSLAGAGRKLRRSAPVVTRMLASLEQRIGTRLIERTTRRLVATEAGLRLGDLARQVLVDYERAVREDANAPLRGTLRVTAPIVFGRRHVAPIVGRYLDMYPEMRVEMVLNDRNVDMIDEGIDVAVRIGALADTSLVARRVGTVRQMLVASPDYLARHGTPERPEDLAHHEIVFTSGRHRGHEWHFRQDGRERTVHLAPRLIVNEIETTLLAVKAGRGIGNLLSYQVADDLAEGRLVSLLAACAPAALPVQLVVPSTRHMAPKLRAFLDHAANSLGALALLRQR